MAKNIHGTRSELIHCDNCGEDYSSTYKRCPFCGARPASTQSAGGRLAGGGRAAQDYSRSRPPEEEDDYVFDGQDVFDDLDREEGRGPSLFRGGGRHLSGGGLDISPTTLIGFIVSGVIVLAAILIVILVIIPMIKGGKTEAVTNSPNGSLPGTSQNQSFSPNPLPVSPSPSLPAEPSNDPVAPTESPSVPVSPSPDVVTSVPPSSGSLTLVAYGIVRTDISISDAYPTPVQFNVEGASGTVTWKSSNTNVVSVSASGVVTAVGRGEASVTATDAAGKSGSCRVLVTVTNLSGSSTTTSPAPSQAPAPSQSQSQAPSGGTLTFSAFGNVLDDFTMSAANPSPVTLKVNGASGTVTWTSSNTNVATVDANGTVTMVGKGRCTVTATDASGNSGSCLVRVN